MTNEQPKQKANQKEETGIDWAALGIQAGIYIVQGALFALGGALMNRATDHLFPRQEIADSNVLSITQKKAA